MAAGDIYWFDQGLYRMMRGEIDLDGGNIKLGFVTSAIGTNNATLKTTADPRWGSGGSTNLSSSQVGTGGTSYTGPLTLASPSVVPVSPDIFFRANTVTLAQDASGFTTARYGIIFQDDANDYAIAFIDLETNRSLVAGQVQIDWNGANNDILKLTN
jgi:hypothetical protein